MHEVDSEELLRCLAVIAAVALAAVAACELIEQARARRRAADAVRPPPASGDQSRQARARASRRSCSATRTSRRSTSSGRCTSRRCRRKGYKVTLKGNIGSSELIYKALQSGQIQGYPEYTGTLLTAIANDTQRLHSARPPTPLASHSCRSTGTRCWADAVHRLRRDRHHEDVRHGAPPDHDRRPDEARQVGEAWADCPSSQTRAQALVGLKKAYGHRPDLRADGQRPLLQRARTRARSTPRTCSPPTRSCRAASTWC